MKKPTKRLSEIVGTTPLPADANNLAKATAFAHDSLQWHPLSPLETTIPDYAPRNTVGWLVRGLRAAFLCLDDSGYFVMEYKAVVVDAAVAPTAPAGAKE